MKKSSHNEKKINKCFTVSMMYRETIIIKQIFSLEIGIELKKIYSIQNQFTQNISR